MAPAFGWVELEDDGDTVGIQSYVRDHLSKAPSEALKPHWKSICAAALQSAYGTIVRAFAARGFSKAQIDQWDFGEEFQRDLAAWFALKRVGVLHPDETSQRQLDDLDRRKELFGDEKEGIPPAVMLIGGVIVEPAGGYGQVSVGPMDTSEDMFVMPRAGQDSRIGQVTRF